MSHRAHHHLAWESLPLLRPATPRHRHLARAIAAAFILGLLIGLLIGLLV